MANVATIVQAKVHRLRLPVTSHLQTLDKTRLSTHHNTRPSVTWTCGIDFSIIRQWFHHPSHPNKKMIWDCRRYTESGVSDASVSAGRAEPIDEYCFLHSQTIFFEPATRTSG